MRSLAEVKFRVRQEAANLVLLGVQPAFSGTPPRSLMLPDPHAVIHALRDSGFAASVEALAPQIIAHRFPLLGVTLETGPKIQWRRDYAHGIDSAATYFRRVSYLNFHAVGDHKFIWELNRHQHLVLLAQAFLFTGKAEYKDEIVAQIESWLAQNSFQRGINWASALEVAFRALSWMWVYHLLGDALPAGFRARLITGLYRHAWHLAENLSVYFSPNTHLLGEAVALHALATMFPQFPRAERWRKRSADIVEQQLTFQVKPDGSHFEQSTYYHVYALDFFVLYYVLAGKPQHIRPAIERMADYLHWLLGPAGRITCFGDDDGGRLFHPYGARDQFGRASLATCGVLLNHPEWIGTREELGEQAVWLLGADVLASGRDTSALPPAAARRFNDSGTVFFQSEGLFVQIDAGPFGYGGAGHSHADTLSLVAWFHGEAVLVDPGTFTYVGDPVERNWFRGTGAHNTVRIDGLDQATPAGPFRWASKPEVTIKSYGGWSDGSGLLDAHCHWGNFTHRRRVLVHSGRLLVLDEIGKTDGPPRDHTCEQIWQLGPAAKNVSLSFSAPAEQRESKFSPAYGAVRPNESTVVTVREPFPIAIAMLLETGGTASGITVEDARLMLGD